MYCPLFWVFGTFVYSLLYSSIVYRKPRSIPNRDKKAHPSTGASSDGYSSTTIQQLSPSYTNILLAYNTHFPCEASAQADSQAMFGVCSPNISGVIMFYEPKAISANGAMSDSVS